MNSIKQEILSDIRKARENIKIAVAWLTDIDFLNALNSKLKKKEFSVEIVLSNHEDNKSEFIASKIIELIEQGAIIKTYGSSNPQYGDFLHCKFYIIDNSFAKSGSYNWSKGAEKNIECLDLVDVKSKQMLFRQVFGNGNLYPKKR